LEKLLQNVVASDDSDLRAQALYLLLKAYYHDGYIEEAFNIVKAIETNYLTSSDNGWCIKLKQDILYAMAKRKFEEKSYEEAIKHNKFVIN